MVNLETYLDFVTTIIESEFIGKLVKEKGSKVWYV